MINIFQELKENAYPGRGIILGITPDAENVAIAYFIMGRSNNSRNRIFIAENEDMRTKAYDESKLEDPSLIIYYPVKTIEDYTIVTNGDQTDTIYDFIEQGKSFEEALNTRTFEPDGPNYTPRISGIVDLSKSTPSYKLSILKTIDGDMDTAQRFYYQYDTPKAGLGHFIHTYKADGEPLPSFEGEPKLISVSNDIKEFASNLWSSLNEDNKVSLFVRFINVKNKSTESIVINRHV